MRLLTTSAALCLAVLLGLGAFQKSTGVRAGTALRMEVPDLARGAGLIVEGRVLAEHPLEVDGRIETEFLLQVERTFLGEDEPYRTVRLPGGVLPDGRGMVLAGMPRLDAGERVLLFLSGEGASGVRMPVGLAQGKLRVLEDEHGARYLAQDTAGVGLVDRDGAPVAVPGTRLKDYAEVVAEIEAALAGGRGER